MDLSQFSSLFEILATFNFAYTLADTFTRALNQKMMSGFQVVRANLKNIKGKLELAKITFFNLKPVVYEGESTAEKIEECKVGLNSFDEKFDDLKKNINSKIELAGVTISFKYLCFLSALYAFFVLVPIGFMTQEPPLILNTCSIKFGLFITDIMMIWFHCYWIRLDRIKIRNDNVKGIGYRHTFKFFLYMAAVWISVYLLNFYVVNLSWQNNYCDTFLVGLTLLAPSLHFAYYFFRAHRNTSVLGENYKKEVQEFEDGFDEWHKQREKLAIFQTLQSEFFPKKGDNTKE